jgi:uncharacterized membrane protein HdeD (DUF308 family)
MLDLLTRRWWIVAARGLCAVAIGLALLASRVPTTSVLVSWFGALALADGVFTVGAGLAIGWLLLFLDGIVGMGVGVFTLLNPTAAVLWFVPLVMIWAVVTGLLEIVALLGLRRTATRAARRGEYLLGASAVAALLFGVLLAFDLSVAVVVGLMAWYAMVSGALLAVLGIEIRTWRRLDGKSLAAS